jgi:hypothetical protein
MKLYIILKYLLTLMCLGLSGSILWTTYRYKHVLEQTHINIFLGLAALALTPILLVIYQNKKR